MTKKILIVGSSENKDLLIQKIMKEHSDDVVFLTPDEIKERGIKIKNISESPTIKQIDFPIIKTMEPGEYKSGKEKRRENRKKNRSIKKRAK
jgi:hypothetical protein